MYRKIIVICGPTATGKTNLGIRLATKFNGEIISADSRQVYKGLDIITGKDIPKNSELISPNRTIDSGYRLKDNIPIWLVDIVDPDYIFNVGEYRSLAFKVIDDIFKRKKLPTIVGGTGLYIRSIIKPLADINIPPDEKLREQLKKLSKEELIEKLKNVNGNKWNSMNVSDRQNPRRLTRTIEIAESTKKLQNIEFQNFDTLLIGLKASTDYINKKIDGRVKGRIGEGAIEEAKTVLDQYKDKNLPAITSTGIRQLKEYIEGKVSLEEAIEEWKRAEHQYAKRQVTWFKKEKEIHWFDIQDTDYVSKIEEEVTKWYTSECLVPIA